MNAAGTSNNIAWLVTRRVALTVLLLWATSVAVNLALEWNAAWNARIVLFPVPIAILVVVYSMLIQRRLASSPVDARRAWWIAWATTPVVILLGLSLMGWDHVLDGRVAMRGDVYQHSPLFALCVSLLMPLAAGIVEEVTVRGYLQGAIAKHMRAQTAQLIAGAVFLGMHGSQLIEIRRLILLVALAAVCGYVTSIAGRVGPAIFIHACVNFGMAAAVLVGRYSAP